MNLKITLLLAAVASTPILAQESEVDFMVELMKGNGTLADSASCLGVSADKFESAIRIVMPKCLKKHGFDSEEAMEFCMVDGLSQKTGVDKRKLTACADEADKQAELAGQDEMESAMDAMRRSSEKTINLITLPIYPQSNVVMHMTTGIIMPTLKGKVQALPAATFESEDAPEKVLAFYSKKLADYEVKKLVQGEILLMPSFPENFNLIEDYHAYMTTEHVMIRKQSGKTLIEIAYKAK
jgi:hypothetical protein